MAFGDREHINALAAGLIHRGNTQPGIAHAVAAKIVELAEREYDHPRLLLLDYAQELARLRDSSAPQDCNVYRFPDR